MSEALPVVNVDPTPKEELLASNRFRSTFATIFDLGTDDGTAMNAVRAMRTMLKKQNVHAAEIQFSADEDGSSYSRLKYWREKNDDLNKRLSDLRKKNVALENEVERLKEIRAENRKLREENKTLKQQQKLDDAERDLTKGKPAASVHADETTSDTGQRYVKASLFLAAVGKKTDKYGVKHWKGPLAYKADMDLKTLNAWLIVGIVPRELFLLVDSLTAEDLAGSSRQKWTWDERHKLHRLLKQQDGMTDLQLAKQLTRTFGRRLLESSITNARRKLRNYDFNRRPANAAEPVAWL